MCSRLQHAPHAAKTVTISERSGKTRTPTTLNYCFPGPQRSVTGQKLVTMTLWRYYGTLEVAAGLVA